ncbi:hypothetical protein O6H91_09G068800 [Diphasiastrum complanatum]|uniref:Uncharacterized protein n=1 Tax=Diphasiastrum complanatum TaxID=34168 RepID=A0ACC2CQJ2_DIPCM|nr:hypothetical protein O6H91_09G068800 [Diphasiastrum complanatum]
MCAAYQTCNTPTEAHWTCLDLWSPVGALSSACNLLIFPAGPALPRGDLLLSVACPSLETINKKSAFDRCLSKDRIYMPCACLVFLCPVISTDLRPPVFVPTILT